MTNVSSYNSGGCGGCGGGGGNAYPAFSRLFVNDIEPCSRNGTINLNEGQVLIDGTADKTTVTGTLQVDGPITFTGAMTTTGNFTAQNTVINGSLNVDSSTLVVDPVNKRVGINTATPTVALDVTGVIKASGNFNCADIDCLTLNTQQLASSVASNLASTVVSSLNCTGNLVVDTNVIKTDITNNRVGVNTTTPTEALDVTGNIKASGTLSVSSNVSAGGLISSGVIRSSTTSTNGMLRAANYVAGATGLSITTAAAVFPWAGTVESNYNFPITQSSGVFTNNTGGTLFILAFYNVYFSASNAGTWRKAWITKENSTTLYGWNQQSAGASCTQAGTTCSGFAYIKVANTEYFQLNVQSDAALTMGTGSDCMMTLIAL